MNRNINETKIFSSCIHWIGRLPDRRQSVIALIFLVIGAAGPANSFAQAIWEGGSGSWTNTANWENNVLPTSTSVVMIDDGKAVNSSAQLDTFATINSLIIDSGDELRILNGQRLHFDGSGSVLTNNGLVQHEGTGFSWIRLVNDLAINGNGTIKLNGGSNGINGSGGRLLTNGSEHTIEGGGGIGSGVRLINNGTIVANLSGQSLTIQSSDSNLENNGTVRAASGGLINMFTSGTMSGGTFEASGAGSRIQFFGGIVQDATFNAIDSSLISSSAPLQIQNLNNLGLIQFQELHVFDNLQNNGTIQFFNSANDNFVLQSDVSVSGGGTLDFRQGGPNATGDFQLSIADQRLTGKGTFSPTSMQMNSGTVLAPSNPGGSRGEIGIFEFVTTNQLIADGVTFEIDVAGILVNSVAPVASQVNTGTNATLPNIDFDQINVFGSLVLQGDSLIDIELTDSFVPGGGDFVDILVADDLQLAGTLDFNLPVINDMTIDHEILNLLDPTTGTNRDVLRIIFVANPLTVFPENLTVTRGTHVTGTAVSLVDSDNIDVSIHRSTSDIQSRTEFEVDSHSHIESPSRLEITLENSVFARSQVTQTIELFDFDGAAWELVDTRNANRFSDRVDTVTLTGNLSRFVQPGTFGISARIRYESISPRQQFASNTDQFSWTIE